MTRGEAVLARFQQIRARFGRAWQAVREPVRTVRQLESAARHLEARARALEDRDPFAGVTRSTPPELSTTAPDPADQPVIAGDEAVPAGVRTAAAWAWRLLLLGGTAYVILWLAWQLELVVVPLVIALLLSALLYPAVQLLIRIRLPRSLATAIVVIGGLAAVVGLLTAVVNEFVNSGPKLVQSSGKGLKQIQDWLKTGPVRMSQGQLNQVLDGIQKWLNDNQERLAGTALDTATVFSHVLAGIFLVIFATFFFLRDGGRIWRFLVGIFPGHTREAVGGAGQVAWRTLVSYVRATVFVAFVDALGIGLSVFFLGVDLALPLGVLVFLGAFIPIVGALVSGSVAVLVALVVKGPFVALIVLGAVIAVMQLESHVLQPLLLGRAVAVHPLAVIVAIGAGVVVAGIVGALVAVPMVAVLNTAIRYLTSHRREPLPEPAPADSPASDALEPA